MCGLQTCVTLHQERCVRSSIKSGEYQEKAEFLPESRSKPGSNYAEPKYFGKSQVAGVINRGSPKSIWWHKSKTLIIPENIRMVRQPPHSPELNPVEHLWEDLRENAMPNAAFRSLDQVEQALCHRLVNLENDPACLRSMTNFPYLRVT